MVADFAHLRVLRGLVAEKGSRISRTLEVEGSGKRVADFAHPWRSKGSGMLADFAHLRGW